MNKLPLRTISAILLTLSSITANAASSHCTANEQTYFSCSTGKKIVSICGSKTQSPDAGFLQYRFGPLGSPELILPADKGHPAKHFAYTYFLVANGNASGTLTVKNGRFRYLIEYIEIIRDAQASSVEVLVMRDEKQVARIPCKTVDFQMIGNTFEGFMLPEK